MESLEHTFRALSDGTRIRILCLLRPGELCVGDLVELLGVAQPTASRHLAYLRRNGLVETRRDGQWAFYSLSKPSTSFEHALLACLDASRQEQPELIDDARRAEALRVSGGCCPAVDATPSRGCGTSAAAGATR